MLRQTFFLIFFLFFINVRCEEGTLDVKHIKLSITDAEKEYKIDLLIPKAWTNSKIQEVLSIQEVIKHILREIKENNREVLVLA